MKPTEARRSTRRGSKDTEQISTEKEPPVAEDTIKLPRCPPKLEDLGQSSFGDLAISALCGTGPGGKDGQYLSLTNRRHEGSGLCFVPGCRLEAKDFGSDIWYGVKVLEVDWDEEEVLIHFGGWSNRYDEWVPMDSSRLRECSKDVDQERKNSKVFSEEEKVLATWSDNRKYAAVIKKVLPDDKYEVSFLDGFKRILKGNRISKIKESEFETLKQMEESAGIFTTGDAVPVRPPPVGAAAEVSPEVIGTKQERRDRKRKINVAELFHKRRVRSSQSDAAPAKVAPVEPVKSRRVEREKKRKLAGEGSESHKSQVASQPASATSRTPVASAGSTRKEERGRSRKRSQKGKTADEGKSNSKPGHLKSAIPESGSKPSGTKVPRKRSRKSSIDDDVALLTKTRQDSSKDTDKVKGKKKDVPESDAAGADEPEPEEEGESPELSEPKGQAAYIVNGADGPRKSIILPDDRLPPGWTKHTIQRKSGNSAGKWDVFLVSPQGRKFRSRNELRTFFEEKKEPFPSERFDFALGRRKYTKALENSTSPSKTPPPPVKGRSRGSGSKGRGVIEDDSETSTLPTAKRVKTLLPKVRAHHTSDSETTGGRSSSSPPPPHTTTVSPTTTSVIPATSADDGEVIVGGLKIQMENSAFKCPKEGCCKNFRKENLLQMHLKHYHPEYNKFVGSTPNVADLAYARTIAESLETPKSRVSVPPSFGSIVDKGSRFELPKKSRLSLPTVNVKPVTPEAAPVERKRGHLKERQSAHGGPRRFHKRSRGDTPVSGCSDSDMLSTEAAHDGEQNTPEEEAPPPAVPSPRDDRREPGTIKTLLPVRRSPTIDAEPAQDDRTKEPTQETTDISEPPPPPPPPLGTPVTKSVRAIRRKQLSDFLMEPVVKKRKPCKPEVNEDMDMAEDGSSSLDGSKFSYRLNKKRTPVVHLEKLHVTTDSNDCSEPVEDNSKSPTVNEAEQMKVEQLRKEEIINCTCGFTEEDGLMIQCDLCLCWQHGICNNIEKESEVPEKYVCAICLNPARERKSKKYMHDQDWLKEGKLPSLSFRSKDELKIAQRTELLKKSHDLTGTLTQLQNVIHSVRVKIKIAEQPDHPKLYLWSKSWEKENAHVEAPEPVMDHVTIGEATRRPTESGLGMTPENLRDNPRAVNTTGEVHADEKSNAEGTFVKDLVPVLSSVKRDEHYKDSELADTTGEASKVGSPEKSSDKDEVGPKHGRGLLQNSLTNSAPTSLSNGVSNQLDTSGQSLLPFPICQTELMRFASTMADNLEAADPQPLPLVPAPAPQPEAPIDPAECRLTLLDHISNMQLTVDSRLTSLEARVAELEALHPEFADDEPPDFCPKTKQTIQMLLRDLTTLREVASLN